MYVRRIESLTYSLLSQIHTFIRNSMVYVRYIVYTDTEIDREREKRNGDMIWYGKHVNSTFMSRILTYLRQK